MTDGELVRQALAELGDVVRCRCHECYTGRGLHDPDCQCDSADALATVEKHIEDLTAERDAWKEQHAAEALGLHVQMQRADAFEAKLANLVEAADGMLDAFCIHETQQQSVAYDNMCAALAEIKREKG